MVYRRVLRWAPVNVARGSSDAPVPPFLLKSLTVLVFFAPLRGYLPFPHQ